jgi:predicted nucleic acid-binding protein
VYPEARAAIAAAARARRLSDETAVVDAYEEVYAELRVIAIDEALARAAGELASRHALRGYDAVHLASALSIEADDVVLVTWDDDLGDAARATGALLTNDRR